MKEAFPDEYNRTTISLPVSSVIRQGFRATFTEYSKFVSEFQRDVIFKTQFFVNYFIISNCVSEIPKKKISNKTFDTKFVTLPSMI
jgi:hypothetical protein